MLNHTAMDPCSRGGNSENTAGHGFETNKGESFRYGGYYNNRTCPVVFYNLICFGQEIHLTFHIVFNSQLANFIGISCVVDPSDKHQSPFAVICKQPGNGFHCHELSFRRPYPSNHADQVLLLNPLYPGAFSR